MSLEARRARRSPTHNRAPGRRSGNRVAHRVVTKSGYGIRHDDRHVTEGGRQQRNSGASFDVRGCNWKHESHKRAASTAIVPGGPTVVSRPDDVERVML